MSKRLSEIIDFLDGNEPNDVSIYTDEFLDDALEVVNFLRHCITAVQEERENEEDDFIPDGEEFD